MQTSPYHPAFVAFTGGGLGSLQGAGFRGFGALGLDPTAGKVVSSGAGYAAGAGATAGAAALGAGGYAAIGAAAGPIGAVVGLVVGIVVTKLLTKNYINVGQMNAAEAAEIAAFNQYRTIAGQAPGRQFGLAAMRAVWKGALHSGFFPLNNETQCFHEGCSAHPGNAHLIDIALDGGSSDRNTFPDLLPQFMSRVQSAPAMSRAMPVVTHQGFAPRPGGRLMGFRGFGAFGLAPVAPMPMTGTLAPPLPAGYQPAGTTPNGQMLFAPGGVYVGSGFVLVNGAWQSYNGPLMTSPVVGTVAYAPSTALLTPPVASSAFPGTPEAVVFIDSFFIPAVSSGAPCSGHPCYWAAPQNATEHQILYDVADAYLAQQSFPSTPFIAKQAALVSQQAPAAILPAGSSVGWGVAPAVSARNPVLNPVATPLLPRTPPAVAVGSGVVTTVNAASNANLDAALSAGGYLRIGTSQDGYPIYQATPGCPAVLNQQCSPGATFVYANGALYPYASAAQVAVTGSAGTGITTPAGGLDPATQALIANMLSQGATAPQAAHAASSKLQAQGVPVTPDVQAQLDAVAQGAVPAPATTSPLLLMIGAGVLAFVLVRPDRQPSNKGPLR
jgi:hypothetical protein